MPVGAEGGDEGRERMADATRREEQIMMPKPVETPDLEVVVATGEGERVVPLTGNVFLSAYMGRSPDPDGESSWRVDVTWELGERSVRRLHDEMMAEDVRLYLRPVRSADRRRRKAAEKKSGQRES